MTDVQAIALDLDGVLTEHPAPLARAARQHFALDLPDHAFVDSHGLRVPAEVRDWVYGPGGPAASLLPAPGARAFLAALLTRFGPDRVRIVTARPASGEAVTRAWLREQGFPPCSLTFTDAKVDAARAFRATHAVEDSPRHARAYAAAGITCLLLGEAAARGDLPPSVRPVTNLEDARRVLLGDSSETTEVEIPGADELGHLAQVAEAAGHLLAVLQPRLPERLDVTFQSPVATEVAEHVVAAALVGALSHWTDRPVTPPNAAVLARILGLAVARSATPGAPGSPPEFTFAVSGPTPHRVTVCWYPGNAGILEVDHYPLERPLGGHLLITHHEDRPGIVGRVGTILGDHAVNIAGMQVGRHRRGGDAIMVLQADDPIPAAVRDEIAAVPFVEAACVVSLPPIRAVRARPIVAAEPDTGKGARAS